jgi:3',5'-cyclic AMP phosphodiesterase CpdA
MDNNDHNAQPLDNNSKDGITRRAALTCMSAWAGTGLVWAFVGGVPRAFAAGDAAAGAAMKAAGATFSFAQISDTHIGFNKEANPEPLKTMNEGIYKINESKPSFVLHTGDITHLSKASEFDTAAEALKSLNAPVHYVPGEHDTLDEGGGKLFLERYGKGTKGNGWYSFDDHGIHFIALVNVFNFKAGHEATIGPDQMKWLEDDLRAVSSSTPVVVFTHIPLWSVYKPWGWGTEDGDQAISLLRRFGSVTVLNGHIHQVIQKVDGNITFHTARTTAYPQPAPGTAPSPGPMTVPADKLRSYLGVTSVAVTNGVPSLIDSTLAEKA